MMNDECRMMNDLSDPPGWGFVMFSHFSGGPSPHGPTSLAGALSCLAALAANGPTRLAGVLSCLAALAATSLEYKHPGVPVPVTEARFGYLPTAPRQRQNQTPKAYRSNMTPTRKPKPPQKSQAFPCGPLGDFPPVDGKRSPWRNHRRRWD